jgi:6-phosphogluconolactonase
MVRWFHIMPTITRSSFLRLACLAAVSLPAIAAKDEFLVYFGTYTREASKGIYVAKFNAKTGDISTPELAAEVESPSFLTIHQNHKWLYAVSEINSFEGKPSGAVTAYSIDPASGKLTMLNRASSGGTGPCHLVVDRTGHNVLVANYAGGTVAVLPIQSDGKVSAPSSVIKHQGSSVDKRRQERPHAHSINMSANNKFAVAADLGLDEVLVYKLDADKGVLAANEPPFVKVAPGSGPRHFAFHPKGRFAYVINEMASTVTAFNWDQERGTFQEIQTITTLPKDFSGQNSTAEVQVHPSGKFVYGSNRGHNSIALFKVDPKKGSLTAEGQTLTEGKTPRNFGIDPGGRYLFAANQDSASVVLFKIDSDSGKLTPTGKKLQISFPVCVKFMALP